MSTSFAFSALLLLALSTLTRFFLSSFLPALTLPRPRPAVARQPGGRRGLVTPQLATSWNFYWKSNFDEHIVFV